MKTLAQNYPDHHVERPVVVVANLRVCQQVSGFIGVKYLQSYLLIDRFINSLTETSSNQWSEYYQNQQPGYQHVNNRKMLEIYAVP